MPPRAKASAAAPKKAAATSSTHASYLDMIKEAIINLKERNGSSRQAIKKYIRANNNLGDTSEPAFNKHISKALESGEKNGQLDRPKGPSGPVKIKPKNAAKTAEKPAAAKPAPEKAPTKAKAATKAAATKPAAKATTSKTTSAKKAEGGKKGGAASTKTASKATTTKAAPAKPKANAGRPRKASASGPAVEDKPVILGKTKSGRITKSTSQPAAPARKAPTKKKSSSTTAAKKATPKRAAASPKKSATPK